MRALVLLSCLSCLAATGAAGEPAASEPPRHDREGRAAQIRALVGEAPRGFASPMEGAAGDDICGRVVTEDVVLEEDLDCFFSVASDSCDRCVLDRITVRGVDDFAVELGTWNLVIRSRFIDNWVGVSSYFGSGRNVVMLSSFEGNGSSVVVGGNDENVIWGNHFTDNGRGVLLFDEDEVAASDNVVIANFFSGNSAGAALIASVEAERNLFARNVFWANRGPGLLLRPWCLYAALCGGTGSRAVRNLFFGNGFDPFEVRIVGEDGVGRTVLVDDGISAPEDVRGNAGLTLAGNRAFLNADLGIEAPGVVDGGGNVGAWNGDRRQCVGVRCRVLGSR